MRRGNAALPSRHFLGFYAGMHIGLFMMPLHRPERDYAGMLAGMPRPSCMPIAWAVLVTESDGEAEDHLARPDNGLRFYYRYLRDQLVPAGVGAIFETVSAMPDEDVTVDYLLGQTVIAGSPATVTARLAALRAHVGPFDTLLAAFHE